MKKYFDQHMENSEFRAAVILAEVTAELASKIKKIRTESGMGQVELAEKLGIKQSQVSKCESAASATFTLRSLAKLADALDCTLEVSFRNNEKN